MQASACLLKQRPVSVIALRCGARPLRQRRSCAAPVMALLSSDKQQRQEKVQQMYREYKAESFSEVESISAPELQRLLVEQRGAVVLVDTRTIEERNVSIIPGAISLPHFEEHCRAGIGKQRVVAYCTVGLRSGKVAKNLRRGGINAVNLAGSILAWTQEGYPLVDGVTGEPTKQVHVFADKWALQGDGYEAVTFATGRGALAVARSQIPGWLGGAK